MTDPTYEEVLEGFEHTDKELERQAKLLLTGGPFISVPLPPGMTGKEFLAADLKNLTGPVVE